MIESLFMLWTAQLDDFLDAVNDDEAKSKPPHFIQDQKAVEELNKFCQKEDALSNLHIICTRANLELVCNFVRKVVIQGLDFPKWGFVVSEFHLIVIDFERTCMLPGQVHSASHAMEVVPHHGKMEEAVHMQTLLEELRHRGMGMEGLNHLGAVHEFDWHAWMGNKYSIPLEIKAGDHVVKNVTVRWGEGGSLDNALGKKQDRGTWMQLKDDKNVVYYKRNKREGDDYGTPDGKVSDIYKLQQEIENDPNCQTELILSIMRR